VERLAAARAISGHALPDEAVRSPHSRDHRHAALRIGCFINVNLTHDVGMDQLILPAASACRGHTLRIPLTQLATAGLSPRDTADASALSNMMRNLGGSVGIAMLSTMIERREHFHFSVLAEAMTQNATRTQERIAMLMAGLRNGAADPAIAKAQALMSLAAQVRREAYVSAIPTPSGSSASD